MEGNRETGTRVMEGNRETGTKSNGGDIGRQEQE